MAERALRVKDVASLYGVTPQMVYGWIREGHIRPFRLPGGGAYRFRPSDLDEFENRCRVSSSNDPTTALEGAETASTSISQTPNLVALDPFQRGRQSARKPRDGGTNG
jgi:excisionase family DNA binding protein